MSKVSRQVAMGAVVAAFLALGASAGPESGAFVSQSGMQPGGPNIGVLDRITSASEPIASVAMRICGNSSQSASRDEGSHAVLTAAFRSCGDRALAVALDAFAEVCTRLK